MKSAELRESFLRYFEGHKHARVASASLVPANDPTLFFTNAGMVQFKDVFLGAEAREYRRATTSQKCMRVSGKHNDLENVGLTPRHHTFFEMLGNFSFGDYFKKEAISFAWEFLTKELALPEDRLLVTIYKEDDEAEKLWKKHVKKGRVFRLGEKDNFWAMADVGPCGPCSEIIFDRKPGGGVRAADLEGDRFMEIWNLVFMQFNRDSAGRLPKLARPSIDTGMGLERLASVAEGVAGNYETDLFMPVIRQLEKICPEKYKPEYSGAYSAGMSMRVIADHIRAMTFLIGDGVQPSNEGRGYVLRRIIRRAARHGKLLNIRGLFFTPLAHTVIDMMGSSYPELIQHKDFIEKVISNEEARFNETLEKGLGILDDKFRDLKKRGATALPGEDVFKLYDTYGFPKDLTEDIARDAGLAIDSNGFEKLMAGQRERARRAWKGSGEAAVDKVYKDIASRGVRCRFAGYETLSSNAKILSIIRDGREVAEAGEGDKVRFVTDVTPFYGESGGQIGDAGMAVTDGVEIEISNAVKPLEGLTVHDARVIKGTIKNGDRLTLAIDAERRSDIARNHTATHILHKALRSALGGHVKQSGSMVAPDRLRFDFSHFTGLTEEELDEIESEANRVVRDNMPVVIKEMPYREAVEQGATAFFGDKYGDVVRVVSVGGYSCELCGGAHVAMTGCIGMIKIVSEASVAAGVRRIEAVTGRGVEEYIRKSEGCRARIAELLRSPAGEIPARVERLISENKKLQGELDKARSDLYSGRAGGGGAEVETIGNVRFAARLVPGADPKEMRTLADNLKSKIKSGIVMLVSEAEGKTSVLVVVTGDLVKSIHAGNLLKKILEPVGGAGGGRPDMAQGGAGVTGKFEELKEALKNYMSVIPAKAGIQ